MTLNYLKLNLKTILKDKIFLILLLTIFLTLLTKVVMCFLNYSIITSSTGSDQNGIYLIDFNKKDNLKINDYVAFCITDEKSLKLAYLFHLKKGGPCINGSYPLVKHICGITGDKITLKNNQFIFNGIPQKNLVLLRNSKLNYNVNWDIGYTLKPNEYFICGKNKMSYDSRYIGPIKTNDIIANAYLIKGY